MKVIRKKPGEAPGICEMENTLEALQKEVGGYIESFKIATDMTILCNEEGKLIPLQPNIAFAGEYFYGTVLAVGVKGEEFFSLRPQVADAAMRWLGVKETWLS